MDYKEGEKFMRFKMVLGLVAVGFIIYFVESSQRSCTTSYYSGSTYASETDSGSESAAPGEGAEDDDTSSKKAPGGFHGAKTAEDAQTLTAKSSTSQRAYVEKVVDGDTFKARILPGGERKITVRILGIDCPESHKNAKCRRDARAGRPGCDWQVPRGLIAAREAAELLKHKVVTLERGNTSGPRNQPGKRASAYGKIVELVDIIPRHKNTVRYFEGIQLRSPITYVM